MLVDVVHVAMICSSATYIEAGKIQVHFLVMVDSSELIELIKL